MPHSSRNPSAHYIEIDNKHWLIDCGEGTQFRMIHYHLKRSKLDGILITHLHGDHYLGLFGLLSSMSMDQRTKPLVIAGHSDLREMINMHLSQGNYKLGYDIQFIALDNIEKDTEIVNDTFLKINAFPLDHRIPCWGFKFQYHRTLHKLIQDEIEHLSIEARKSLSQGINYNEEITLDKFTRLQVIKKSYAYCSDTRYSEKVTKSVMNVDALYHETTFLADNSKRAEETFHSTTKDAAKVALETNTKKLLIGHFSSRYEDPSCFLEEVKETFDNACIAEEGKEYII
jgi:ribonuclease Z